MFVSAARSAAVADPDAYLRKEGEDAADLVAQTVRTLRDPQLAEATEEILERTRVGDLAGISKIVEEAAKDMRAAETALREAQEQLTEEDIEITTVEDLLQPGHSFLGTIRIPIPASGEDSNLGHRTEYSLQVLRTFVDERGERRTLVRHAAHGDEQMCVLTIGNAGKISFKDFETLCEGEAKPAEQLLAGTVGQLQHGMEEFPLDGDKDEHTFSLRLQSASARLRTLLVELREKQEVFGLCFAVHKLMGHHASMVRRNNSVADVPSVEVVKVFLDMLSTLNTMMMQKADLLHATAFASTEEKTRQLSELTKEGCSRADAHAACDGLVKLLVAVHNACISGIRSEDENSAMIVRNRAMHIQHRSSRSYERFDRALRAAENRVPVQVLEDRYIARAELPKDANSTCCICLEDFSDDCAQDARVVLPRGCGHGLHMECAKRWYWLCDTCPQCRRPFETA